MMILKNLAIHSREYYIVTSKTNQKDHSGEILSSMDKSD